jgi:hypothetical protein
MAALVVLAAKLTVHNGLTLAIGLVATAFAGYVSFWSRIHPKIYLGKGLAVGAFLVSAAATYVAFSELAQAWVWDRTFQLTDKLNVFRAPEENWSVAYPKLWSHEEQRVSGTVIHRFKPSRPTPTMFFQVTSRENVGTTDLSLVVQSFFRNLPNEKDLDIIDREITALPTGQPAYRLVYSELGRRIPLKNEVLFVLDGSRLFYITVAASPRWFDRQRGYLRGLLYSFRIG